MSAQLAKTRGEIACHGLRSMEISSDADSSAWDRYNYCSVVRLLIIQAQKGGSTMAECRER